VTHRSKIAAGFKFTGLDVREMQCVIPERNRRRFYRIELTQGLWCPLVTRAWGRIGCSVRFKVDFFDKLEDALDRANKLLAKRIRRGYKIINESLVENAIPVHPVETRDIKIQRKKPDNNLSFPFYQ
jgi:predicted DNA-binding WGR domain protein